MIIIPVYRDIELHQLELVMSHLQLGSYQRLCHQIRKLDALINFMQHFLFLRKGSEPL